MTAEETAEAIREFTRKMMQRMIDDGQISMPWQPSQVVSIDVPIPQHFTLKPEYIGKPIEVSFTMDACDHDWKVYDSGFSRFEYCQNEGCKAERKLV